MEPEETYLLVRVSLLSDTAQHTGTGPAIKLIEDLTDQDACYEVVREVSREEMSEAVDLLGWEL